jgi:hypothetical protein
VLRNKLYYNVKPLIPLPLRWAVRRWLALRQRPRVSAVWPIAPGSERPPKGWPGWPEGKEFGVVLTHDIEGKLGLQRCRELMELDLEMGFRSSFNFTPEGSYSVPRDLRQELERKGFEVAVHDLHHDGKLYEGRQQFSRKARRINEYLAEWGAVGFRSAYMLHKLDWLHELHIHYDASTFDTDPFEPQPEGRHTIFPFWVPAPANRPAVNGDARRGYVELPYTLPQDSTMFLLFGERTNQLWKDKVDWVARHGGMVLLTTHPDYMQLGPANSSNHAYSPELYREFLRWLSRKYAGSYWHALPREVTQFCQQNRLHGEATRAASA